MKGPFYSREHIFSISTEITASISYLRKLPNILLLKPEKLLINTEDQVLLLFQ